MEEKTEIIRYLVRNNILAPSMAELVRQLGGGESRSTLDRLMKNGVKEVTVNETWNKIRQRFFLSDEDLYGIVQIWEAAKYLHGKLRLEMDTVHPDRAECLVRILVLEDYQCCSPAFQKEVAPQLKDLRKDDPYAYWRIVTLLYIRCKETDPYKGGIRRSYLRVLDDLDDLLCGLYPEKADAHEVYFNLRGTDNVSNLWSLTWNCAILCRCYTEEDFKSEASKCLQLFPWGKRSYWHTSGQGYKTGGEVWLLVEQTYRRSTNGFYLALRLEAGKDTRTFLLKDTLVFCFWMVEDEEKPSILQVSRGIGPQLELCYYLYGWDADSEELHLEEVPEYGNLFELPPRLKRVDFEHPEGKDEKVWAHLLEKWDEEQGSTVFRQAKEQQAEQTELQEEYQLTDVQISRTRFALCVEHQGKALRYELPIDAYDFLSEINPSQCILLTRNWKDNQVCVMWPDLGYMIRLEEFSVTDQSTGHG